MCLHTVAKHCRKACKTCAVCGSRLKTEPQTQCAVSPHNISHLEYVFILSSCCVQDPISSKGQETYCKLTVLSSCHPYICSNVKCGCCVTEERTDISMCHCFSCDFFWPGFFCSSFTPSVFIFISSDFFFLEYCFRNKFPSFCVVLYVMTSSSSTVRSV